MILIAGGDSFVFGSELQDQINGPSMSTYAAILSKHFNLKYDCVALAGGANNAISRTVMTACVRSLNQGIKVGALVTWTFANRYEFRFNYYTGRKTSPWHSITAWSVVDNINNIEKEFKSKNVNILDAQKKNIQLERETGIAEFAKTWYKHVGDSEYYEVYSSLKEILFLQNFFEINQIPFLFLIADNHFFQHPNYYRQKDEYLEALYNRINWNKWFFFEPGTRVDETKEPRGFYQWAVENKYPIGTTHPLEQAHSAAAELIKEKFNEMVIKPLEQNSIRNSI